MDITLDSMNLQFELEENHNKNQQMKRLTSLLSEEIGDIPHREFVLKLMAHLLVLKRADIPTIVGIMTKPEDDPQKTVEILEQCSDYFILDNSRTGSWEVITKIVLSKEIEHELSLYMFPLPMVIEPSEVTHNYHSGYYSDFSKHLPVVTGSSNVYVPLDIINTQNCIPLSVNLEVFNHGKVYLKNIHGERDSYKRKKKVNQFNRFMDTTKQLLTELNKLTNELYLTHFYDKRGRLYCRGTHLNYQGFDWQKGLVEFANKEHLES